jgi:hypothetical protein
LVHANLADAEADEALYLLASTYDSSRESVVPGIGPRGPRILNFAPMLVQEEFPLNEIVKALLSAAEKATKAKVEVEFAITFRGRRGERPGARIGFLQIRSTVVSDQLVDVTPGDVSDPRAIVASDMVIGNGTDDEIQDIVFLRPDKFSILRTTAIARQLEPINRELQDQHRPFLLIGFGRWGSTHPSLGIPVDWSQISGARAIVEATLPEMNVELSQGSHFFHNLSSFRASYFMVRHGREFGINWDWLERQPVMHETELIRHVRLKERLSVRVDGRTRRGIILPGVRKETSETQT